MEVVEGQGAVVGVIVGVVAVQHAFNLLGDRMGEGDATGVFLQQRLEVGWEKVGVGNKELAVFLLPLVSMRLNIAIFQMGFQMGGFVEEHPKEEPWVEIAVDGNFMEGVIWIGVAVIAEFGHPFKGDMEVNLMAEEIVVNPIHRLRREMITKYPSIALLWRH